MPAALQAAIQAWRRDSGLGDDEALAELGRQINPQVVAAKLIKEEPISYFSSVPPGESVSGRGRVPERAVVGLTASEAAEVEGLKRSFARKELDPEGQVRLAALLDRVEEARLAKQKAARKPAWGAA